jgi:hypothetical protein
MKKLFLIPLTILFLLSAGCGIFDHPAHPPNTF